MTGPPHLSGKTSPAQIGQPAADVTSTTVYQFSLASASSWIESGADRTLKMSNMVNSNSIGKYNGNSVRSQSITTTWQSGAALSGTQDGKLYMSGASSSTNATEGSMNCGSSTANSTRSKIYNIQLPVLFPERSSRRCASFSSSCGGSGNSSVWVSASAGSDWISGPPMYMPPQGSLPFSNATSQTISAHGSQRLGLVITGRGLSRTPIDDPQPIDNIKDIDLLTKPYGHNLQTALESYLDTPCSSGRSSPTVTMTQTPLSIYHGGWTPGNTTERSSLDSSYSLDDFDKLATNTVCQHFDEINSVLFEGAREASSSQTEVVRECQEWSAQFPHLRILGKQVCPPKDTGYCHVPLPQGSQPASSSLVFDATDSDTSCSDSQGLTLMGQKVSAVEAPCSPLSGSDSAYSFLMEEVIEEDGVYEDIIAVDYKKTTYEESIEHKNQLTPRRRRIGYPPITPNACVKDSVTSAAFDHMWQEVMSWMRELLKKFASEITDSRHDIVSFSPTNNSQSPLISREVSLIMQNSRQYSFQRSNTNMGSNTERSIDGILQISSMPLKYRQQGHHLMDPSESQVLSSVHSGSSFMSSGHSQPRPTSHLRLSQRGVRAGRLAPIAKTSSFEDEKGSYPSTESLRVKGRNPMTNENLPSPPSSFQRNGSLPPLEIERTPHRKLHQGYRAASAVDKDINLKSIRDRTHMTFDQSRPNTTNAMRSDTPQSVSGNHGNQSRRSSTALGNTNNLNTRNPFLSNRSLDVRGNSLQLGGDSIHFHPDIQEDQHESPEEEVYRSHWNAPQQTHSVYRRSRVSLR